MQAALKKTILILTLIVSTLFSYPCGGDWDPEEEYYNFFHQNILRDKSLVSFLYDPYMVFYGFENPGLNTDPNIDEWLEYLGKAVNSNDASFIVYSLTYNELVSIKNLIDKKSFAPAISDSLMENTLVKLWKNKKNRSVIDYLLYAKECEGQAVIQEYSWHEEVKRDELVIKELIEKGKNLYVNESEKFLKLRYSFQLVRLAHYLKDYELSAKFFDDYTEPLGLQNYIYYRALEQKAGALNGLGSDEAAYLFSKVFDYCSDRRETCLLSFGFTNQESWDASFSYCKTNKEKAVFYTMRALKQYGYAIEEMENIYAVDPESPYLELLLARQINMMEREAYPSYNVIEKYPSLQGDLSELSRLKILCDKMISENVNGNKDLWKVAKAYIGLMLHNYGECQKITGGIGIKSGFYSQAMLINYVSRLSGLDSVNIQIETEFASEYYEKDYLKGCSELKPFMMDVFSVLYQKQGDIAKAYLCHNNMNSFKENINLKLLNSLEAFLLRKEYNPFEKWLISSSEPNALERLIEMRGTYYLQRNQLKEALHEFNKLSAEFKDDYYNNSYINSTLFSGSIRHYFDTPIEQQSDSLYMEFDFLYDVSDKKSLTEALLKLEKLAESDSKNAAKYYYLIGNAWNNMSPEGWHRPVLFYNHENWFDSSLNHGLEDERDGIKTYKYYEQNTFFYFNPEIPLIYFEKALTICKDKELKAKIYFMAAKADLAYKGSYVEGNDSEYFEVLKNEYSDTEYFKEAIEECSYLSHYVYRK